MTRRRRGKTDPEAEMAAQIQYLCLPPPVREHRFHPVRKWRFDFAWPDRMVALEVEGISRGISRHQTISGYREDCVKYAEALVLGWRVLRVVQDQVRSGQALSWLAAVLGVEP